MVLKMFKGLLAAYYIIGVGGILAVCILVGACGGNSIVIILTAVMYALLTAFLFTMAANKKLNQLNSIRENCRTYLYISKLQKLLEKNQRGDNGFAIRMNLFAGYSDIGDKERAREMFSSIQPQFKKNAQGVFQAAIYYLNLYMLQLWDRDFEKAGEALDTAKNYLDNPLLLPQQRMVLISNYMNKRIELSYKQGDFNGVEVYYRVVYDAANIPLEKVSAAYGLAEICIHNEADEKAKEYLTFILENGGDTYYVNRAKEMLEQIKEKEKFR